MSPAERLDLLVRGEGKPLQAAVLELAGMAPGPDAPWNYSGRNALAERIEVDPKIMSRTLAGEIPGLHVRRGLEAELGLPPYTLDKYLDGGAL